VNPRNSEPTTEARDAVAGTDPDDGEEIPPWPERGPEIVDTVPPDPEPDPIPLPGPDPAPEPAPVPHPEPDPAPEPIPLPDPDPVPEPGPVSPSVLQDEGTDEGSADLDDLAELDEDDLDDGDEVDDGHERQQLELLVHEEPELAVATVDDDVDVELEVDPAVGRPLLTDAGVWEERWAVVQAGFVDDPGLSIHQADRLVTDAMEEVARLLLARREALQDRWRSGAGEPPPDTEQLRITVQGYRALLFGLLSV
jgi:hypothetical protein